MAIKPAPFDPKARAKAGAQKLRDAWAAARTRTGSEGRLVALSAGGLFLAFVLLAALAPILIKAPAWLSSLIGFVLLALVLVATFIGGFALWRLIKAGAREGQTATPTTGPIFSQSAVEAALSDAEDAGLRAVSPRVVQDAMTGRLAGRPIAVIGADGVTYGIARLKQAVPASLLLAPGHAPWPHAFPNDGALTPIPVTYGIDALAWSTQREDGMALCAKLGPALAMSAAGGQVPFVSVRGRALVMMWRGGDIGTASVIMAEAIRAMVNQ
jgi:hypothetical protein